MRLRGLALAGALLAAPAAAQGAPTTTEPGMAADVAYLASRRLNGRAAGSAGGDSAASFIAARFAGLQLAAAFGGCPAGCRDAYFQPLPWGELGRPRNVGAWSPAGTPGTGGRYLVVGAHFDHLGRNANRSRDPEAGDRFRPGADDNASGVAVMLELARRFAERPAPLPILFVGIDAEEGGLMGSAHLVHAPPAPLDSAVLMLNLDMVGRMRGATLLTEVAAPRAVRPRLSALLASVALEEGLRLRQTVEIAGRSDHASFAERGVPAVALFTGFHPEYHTARDTPNRLNLEGMASVADFAERLLRRLAAEPPGP